MSVVSDKSDLVACQFDAPRDYFMIVKSRDPNAATLARWTVTRPGFSDEALFVPILGESAYFCRSEISGAGIRFDETIESCRLSRAAPISYQFRRTRRFESAGEVRSRHGMRVVPISYGGERDSAIDFMREIRAMKNLNMYPVTEESFFSAGSDAPLFSPSVPEASALPRTAVVVHLHYQDLWNEIAAKVATVPGRPDLVITVTADDTPTLRKIVELFPHARVVKVPNRGFDIWPFLQILRDGLLDRVELICKIHSKKSLRPDGGESLIGTVWRRQLLDALLGDQDRTNAIVDRFRRDPTVGLIGPARLRVRDESSGRLKRLGKNRKHIVLVARAMGIGETDLTVDYFAGSMFWVRQAALEPIRGLALSAEQFAEPGAGRDGTLAHAIERLFNASTIKAGFRVEDVPDRAQT